MSRRPRAALALLIGALVSGGVAAGGDSSDEPRPAGVDHIVVDKHLRELSLLSGDEVVRTYSIALGGEPRGPKEREGDERTPEGAYTIDLRNPHSAYHLSLRISYPNAADRERARAKGVAPGGDIMIHGLPNGLGWLGSLHRLFDWTDGCIAVTDAEIDEIWERVPLGTPIEIRP